MAVQQKTPRFYPVHPTAGPVSPAKLNTHLRLLVDNDADAQTAFQSLMSRLQVGQIAVSVIADGTSTVTIIWPNGFQDANYAGLASVEGTSLQVVNVLRSKANMQVTVLNTDGANPHSGTVMALGFRF
jgi:hypothetical protein